MRSKVAVFLLMLCILLTSCASANSIPASAPTATPTAVPTPTPDPSPTPVPTPEPTPDPTPEEVLLQEMTLEEKVAQFFFVRCPDVGAEEMIASMQPGALLLFGRDFNGLTTEQVKEKLSGYQAQAKLPMLIGVDEEGGTVVRVSSNPQLSGSRFQSPRTLYAEGGIELLCGTETAKCELLRSLGINVNFAPVCDISDDPAGFMYYRSLGLSAEETSEVISRMTAVYAEQRVGCVLKHFPGYGNASDTHEGVVFDDRPFESFETVDLLPFMAGVEAGADCVLVTHSIVSCVDAERPASLSPAWNVVLREQLGFDGVIITDDLAMGAIQKYTDNASAAVDAILAGNDMLCCSDYETQYSAVLEAVQNGVIEEARIDESVLRILCWKRELGLLE